jgi:hypothetical protein
MNLRRFAITLIGMAALGMASLVAVAAPASADVLSLHASPHATGSRSLAALGAVSTAQAPEAVALVDMRAQPSPSARALPGEGSRFSFVAFRGPDTMKRPADDIKDCTRQ